MPQNLGERILNLKVQLGSICDLIRSQEQVYEEFFKEKHQEYWLLRIKGIDTHEVEQVRYHKDNFIEYYEEFISKWKYHHSLVNKIDRYFATILSSESINSEYSTQLINSYVDELSVFLGNVDKNSPMFMFDCYTYHIFLRKYKSIELLMSLPISNNNIILVGANGSGKSTFAQLLKGSETENISVIPAQKTLTYSQNNNHLLNTNTSDIRAVLLQDNIGMSKQMIVDLFNDFQINQFTKVIIALHNENNDVLNQNKEDGKSDRSTWDDFFDLWKILFPKIAFTNRNTDFESKITPKIDDNFLSLNSLSEGEKAAMYYISTVLLAKENSYVIVDEPETYLNPSIFNPMWDLLISKRPDCKFVFITHSVDFVQHRQECDLVWIQYFTYPDTWNFKIIDINDEIPTDLLTQILGSSKPILFCEGEKQSLDYRVYTILFGEKYTVIPSGGHEEVKKYVTTYNKLDKLNRGNRAIGIVDRDNMSDNNVGSLSEKSVFTGYFNEIEMFLVNENLVKSTLKNTIGDDSKFYDFKEEFFAYLDKHKIRIAMISIKKYCDEMLNGILIHQ